MQCTSIIRFRYIPTRNYRALSLIRINTKVSGISVIFLYSIALILDCFGNFVAYHFHDMKLIDSWVIKVWSFVRLKFLKFLNFELKLFWIKKTLKKQKIAMTKDKVTKKSIATLLHCGKSVFVRSCVGPHFPAFGLNTERYVVYSPNARKCEPE